MKVININLNAVVSVLAALVIAVSVPAQADETDFTLEDSIRHQIFLELKSNVKDLYQTGNLLVPNVDTSVSAIVASSNANSNYISPLNSDEKTGKNEAVGNIN
jgi:hypothetical protein